MVIKKIYSHYQIPPNLSHHMLQVAAVGEWICEHWTDQNLINQEIIRQTLLLHDMGNLIKFDLEAGKKFLGQEAKKIDFWKQVQQQFIATYGDNEHEATYAIATEIGVDDQVLHALQHMGSSHLEETKNNDDYTLKICSYADMRIAPHGLVSVEQRFDDGIERYKNRPGFSFDRAQEMRSACLILETQLQNYVSQDLTKINAADIESHIHKLQNISLPIYEKIS